MKNFMKELVVEWVKKHEEEREVDADDEVLLTDQVPYSPYDMGSRGRIRGMGIKCFSFTFHSHCCMLLLSENKLITSSPSSVCFAHNGNQ